jgi:hypothetical protein
MPAMRQRDSGDLPAPIFNPSQPARMLTTERADPDNGHLYLPIFSARIWPDLRLTVRDAFDIIRRGLGF